MKKVFNLSITLAVLAAAFSFTSCSNDEDAATITVSFDQNGVFLSGNNVTGKITSADEDLTKVTIYKADGSAYKNYTSFGSLPIEKGSNGVYTISITDLPDGSYSLQAISKTGDSGKKDFTVGTNTEIPPYDVLGTSADVVVGKTYGFQQGALQGQFTVSAASATSITLSVNGGAAIILSDAGQSYLTTTFTAIGGAAAKEDPSKVLLIKKSGVQTLASGKLANDATIAAGATETNFVVFK